MQRKFSPKPLQQFRIPPELLVLQAPLVVSQGQRVRQPLVLQERREEVPQLLQAPQAPAAHSRTSTLSTWYGTPTCASI